jgi:folate-dependent phosphoribosylglycinamide formyltransferase PurN
VYSIGWFSTGRDEAARQLLETVHGNIKKGEIEAEISFVFSNREPGEAVESDLFFELVKGYGIPLIQFSSTRFKSERQAITSWRSEYDREVMRQLRDFRHHLCVLAGYMLIVGDEMCQKYNMINLHPAFPGGPTGTWQEVIWKLIESKAESSGVMIHLVTPQLDRGPAVAYCTFSTRGGPFDRYWAQIEGLSPEEVKQRGESLQLFKAIRHYELIREFPLIIATIKAFSEGKIRISQEKQVVNAEGRPINGYNLTGKINELVKQAEYRSSKG